MLTGKNAVVTGSTSGIGLAIARGLAAQGANVMINGLGSAQDNEAIRQSIEADFAVKVLFSPANMLKPEQIVAMIAEAEQTFGSVDILVNNAGIKFVAPIEEYPND